jgi:UPF0755 protein
VTPLRRAVVWVTVSVALLVAVTGWSLYAVFRDRSYPATQTQVIVQQGETFDEIARRLAADGVVGNVLTFRTLARLRGQDTAVRAGEYRFAAHQTQDEILRALVGASAQVAVWVTIPEGFTAAQIATRLQEAGAGSAPEFFQHFMQNTIVVDGTRTKNLEGFLFPNTYLVPLGETPQRIAELFTAEFFSQLPPDAADRARALHVTVPQAVTVASMVEREAKADVDRPKIAAVIYNRLRLKMPLQVDATIEYALPSHKSQLSAHDLRIDSPYNSYAHAGLPPTPIANPGRPSLEAALHPSKSDDLYYVYCGNGRHVFAKTLAEHNVNVARCLR